MNIGLVLRLLRKHRGLTLKELEGQSHVCLATISRIETGRSKKINIYDVMALAKALNVGVGTLLVVAEKISTREVADVGKKLAEAQVGVRCLHDEAAQELKILIENLNETE